MPQNRSDNLESLYKRVIIYIMNGNEKIKGKERKIFNYFVF